MDQGAVGAASGRAGAPPALVAPVGPAAATGIRVPRARRRRGSLALDLALLGGVGILLAVAAVAAFATVQEQFYSPSAFVERYIGMLADGDAAGALAVPGVTVSSADLEAAELPPAASEALLRRAALAPIGDVRVVSEVERGGVSRVTVEYDARGYPGRTTFEVVRDGSIGIAPTWRFATSPLAVMELTVGGSMVFEVNGFEVDKRQVSPEGADADPLAPVPLLVFSPLLYSVSVDTPVSHTPGVAVLSDSPFTSIPISVQAQPTEEFVSVVQQKVEEFLTACTTQRVLQPTACPFGYPVEDRIDSLPIWSIAQQPTVSLSPEGAHWRIDPSEAVAHIDVDIRSLFDGRVETVSEDVPFVVEGTITLLPDGTASIMVTGTDAQ